MAAYAFTVTLDRPTAQNLRFAGEKLLHGQVNITNYNTTTAEITDITEAFIAVPRVAVSGLSSNGYAIRWNRTDKSFEAFYTSPAVTATGTIAAPAFTGTANVGTSGVVTDSDTAASLGHAVYVVPMAPAVSAPTFVAEAAASGLVIDSDTAATEGVALYVVVDDPNFTATYQLGHLEFVSPTDANGTCTVANGAATLTVFDDDAAATNGVAVRAVAAGAGWEATTAASKDILVPTSSGDYIFVNHATTGSTPELYFDEDAANTYDRIRAVMVDNANEPYALYAGSVAATELAPQALNQGAPRLASLVTVGPKPFTYLVGASGPEITIASRPDVASLPGAVALYVQAAAAGFNAANFGKEDLYVPVSNGEFLKIAYAASPAGVQVYSYPEGATGNLALQAVVADNADETFSTEAAIGWKRDTPAGTVATPVFTGSATSAAAASEVASDVDIGTFDFIAVGR